MALILIIQLVEVAMDAFVYVASTVLEHAIGHGHAFELIFVRENGCSFWHRPIWQPWRVVLSENRFDGVFVYLTGVFVGQTATLRNRNIGVCRMSVVIWTKVWGIQESSTVIEIFKFLQIYSSVSKSASV